MLKQHIHCKFRHMERDSRVVQLIASLLSDLAPTETGNICWAEC